MMLSIRDVVWILLCVALMSSALQADKALVKRGRTIFIDNVWTGCNAGYSMASYKGKQYVAYYDADRWMTVACRDLDSEKWEKKRLDNQVGWDGHNGVTMAFDSDGQLHVSGNMHCVPLRYYRTTVAGDISTLTPINKMTGVAEKRVTYPRFYRGPKGEFLFTYRDGGSGDGVDIINVYDVKTKAWSRYIETPILDGQDLMNAYGTGPVRDKSGVYHMAWVWRDTPDCSTNHDVSYARSPGSLMNWQKSDGTPITLPITIENCEILDRAQPNEGLINFIHLNFDSEERPMVTYLKFDPKGKTQLYTMRLEANGWKRYQITDWPDRWEFSGVGGINSMIGFSGLSLWNTGMLYQTYTNKFQAPYSQIRFLDEKTLQQVGAPMRIFPEGFDTPSAHEQGEWRVNMAGFSLEAIRRTGSSWPLRWETLAPNRDKPRDFTPPPSRLELVELVADDGILAGGKE